MRIKTKATYNPHDFKKLKFLKKSGDRIFNGNFDVTEVKKKLPGIITGDEEIRMKDYLVYRPLPKALLALGEKPKVHPDSYDMQVFYKDVFQAVNEGVHVDGEYYNPFFMLWMTIFVFEIPGYDDDGNLLEDQFEVGKPVYSTIDRYILDVMWKAYKQRKYVALMSGRGIGKSFITTAIMMWYYMFHSGQELLVTGTSEDITSEAWSKVQDIIDFVEKEFPGLSQHRSTDSQKKIKASVEFYDGDGELKESGTMNEIEKIIYADNPNSTRGRRPHFQHVEEFAAFPSHPSKGSLKNVIGQSKGSWLVQGSIKKAFVIYTGTGGSVNNSDAEAIFMKPRAFNLLPIKEWAPDGINIVETGLFIPSQLKYGGTWEHYGTPDIALAIELMLRSRKDIEEDAQSYIQELQEFPMVLEEVFLRKGTNNFNQDKITEQLVTVKNASEKAWKTGRLEWVIKNGTITGVIFVEKRGGDICIVEKPQTGEDGTPLKHLYVAGLDGIDQGNNDSLVEGSKLAMVVKKRIPGNFFSGTSNVYVAFYNKRSDDVRTDYANSLKLAIYYGAKVNVEYTKIGVISYFRDKGYFRLLAKRPSIAIGANVSGKKASMLIGTPATGTVIDHQDEKLGDYIEDYYYNLVFLPALEQLKNYSREDRTKFDLVIAMGLAELLDEDMLGKKVTENDSVSGDLADFGFYRDAKGKKRWGEIPTDRRREIKSIAVEEMNDRADEGPYKWVDPTD